jgi:hypothetical protein
LSGASGNSEESVKVLLVSGIQNRNGIGEITKSDRRKKGRKTAGMNE